jgi:hypothetical protein
MSRDGYAMAQRPSVVTAASVLLYIFAALGIVSGLILLGAGSASSGVGTLLTLLLLGMSVVYLVLATMILSGRNGARITAIVLLSVSIVFDLVEFDTSSVISIGLGLLVIGLLAWNRDAQEYFRQ